MQYNLEDNASTLSLSIASSPTQAKEWLGQVEDHYKRMRAKINPVHSLSPDAFAALSKYEPKTMVLQEKNYLITLNNAVDGAVDLILDLKKKLKEKAISK
ncbi:hypothetical protein GF373_16400 [bacterium]|nr:hypothetical protein [bacterium]